MIFLDVFAEFFLTDPKVVLWFFNREHRKLRAELTETLLPSEDTWSLSLMLQTRKTMIQVKDNIYIQR